MSSIRLALQMPQAMPTNSCSSTGNMSEPSDAIHVLQIVTDQLDRPKSSTPTIVRLIGYRRGVEVVSSNSRLADRCHLRSMAACHVLHHGASNTSEYHCECVTSAADFVAHAAHRFVSHLTVQIAVVYGISRRTMPLESIRTRHENASIASQASCNRSMIAKPARLCRVGSSTSHTERHPKLVRNS